MTAGWPKAALKTLAFAKRNGELSPRAWTQREEAGLPRQSRFNGGRVVIGHTLSDMALMASWGEQSVIRSVSLPCPWALLLETRRLRISNSAVLVLPMLA